jgi:hypothetical protein
MHNNASPCERRLQMDRAAMLNEETNTTGDIASASRNDSDKTLRFTWTAVALDSRPLTSHH